MQNNSSKESSSTMESSFECPGEHSAVPTESEKSAQDEPSTDESPVESSRSTQESSEELSIGVDTSIDHDDESMPAVDLVDKGKTPTATVGKQTNIPGKSTTPKSAIAKGKSGPGLKSLLILIYFLF